MTRRIVIVGGGITGLAALEHVTRVAPDQPVTLIEASGRLGGHIRTERHDDFVMEAGPDVILTSKPAAVELAKRVGLGNRLQGTNPAVRGSYILSRGRLRRVPDGLTGLVPSRFAPFIATPVISPLGKLRVGLEYFLAPSADGADESIEQFVVRRLGREMYDNLVEPLLSGISAGDGSRLSIAAMFPQLRALEREHGGLARGMLAKKRAERARRATGATGGSPSTGGGFASFPGGLEELVCAVEQTVARRNASTGQVEVRLRTGVTRLERSPSDDGALTLTLGNGQQIDAASVILATPAFASSAMLGALAPELSRQLAAVEYASTATMSLVYPLSALRRPLDATGYVVPRCEGRAVLACTWTSAKFVGRAPDDQALIRLFLGGAGRRGEEALSDDALLELAAAEMREILGVTVPPWLYRINRFSRALPQYTVGHVDRMTSVANAAALVDGLELAGAVYRGVGIPDCVQSGVDAAARALRFVESRTPTLTASLS